MTFPRCAAKTQDGRQCWCAPKHVHREERGLWVNAAEWGVKPVASTGEAA